MAVPKSFAIHLLINGVNCIANAPYKDMDLDDMLNAVSSFNFRLENPDFVPLKFDAVQVVTTELEPNHTVFIGYIIQVEEEKHDNGIVSDYVIECADRKIRLQKAVVFPKIYTGIDTDILDDLITDSFPDLSDIYDFSNAENVADDLNLPANNDSLWDMLKDLQDKTGANARFEEPKGEDAIITFDDNSWQSQGLNTDDGTPHWAIVGASWLNPGGLASAGNPDICARWLGNDTSITFAGQSAGIRVFFGGDFIPETVDFDYYVSGNADWEYFEAFTGQENPIAGAGAWHHASFTLSTDTASGSIFIGLRSTDTINGSLVTMDIRIDNVQIKTSTAYADSAGKDNLVWSSDLDDADFDLDIDLSDEFGFNFNPTFGSWDDFNAIVVTGGKSNQDVEFIYPSNGVINRLNLELPFTDYTIYTNSGSDVSPSWDALDDGLLGVDKLTGDGGTKDVLYDGRTQWLIFETPPPDLKLAVRITGNIQIPIQVVVNAAGEGEPIFVTSIFDETITSEEEALQKGQAELNKRNVLQRLEFDTYEPWLKVGTRMNVVDSARGLSASLLINRVTAKWIGSSGHAQFHVECGNDEEAGAGQMIANNERRSRKKGELLTGATVISYEALLASDGTPMIASNGQIIYQEA